MDRTIKIESHEIVALILSVILTGIFIKLPLFLGMDPNDDMFFFKNGPMIALGGLSLYLLMAVRPANLRYILVSAGVFLGSAVYINLLPSNEESQSVMLVCLHLPLLLWSVYGLIYMGFDTKNLEKRVTFIKYNGDLVILCALLSMAGGVLAGASMSLFYVIKMPVESFIVNYIALWGIVSVPIVSTFLIRNFRIDLHLIARIIAILFSPLTLITLIAFLASIPAAGNNPYSDRNFLLVFNLMLLGIMGLIAFAVSESATTTQQRFITWILFLLVFVSLCIDLLALSAILYRLNEYGFSANRCAVLGANLLMAGNLSIILMRLYKTIRRKAELKQVENDIARYLPAYALWVAFVAFTFPLLFGI